MIDELLGPEGPEVSCDECFERLDEYVSSAAIEYGVARKFTRRSDDFRLVNETEA